MEEGMRKLNITEDMAENRKQWKQLRSGKLGAINEDDNDDDDDDDDLNYVMHDYNLSIFID